MSRPASVCRDDSPGSRSVTQSNLYLDFGRALRRERVYRLGLHTAETVMNYVYSHLLDSKEFLKVAV